MFLWQHTLTKRCDVSFHDLGQSAGFLDTEQLRKRELKSVKILLEIIHLAF